MSADNGVYILQTPKQNGSEFRVAHCSAVENIYINGRDFREGMDLEWARTLFGDSPVFDTLREALFAANQLHSKIGWTEYGINELDSCRYSFPRKDS